MAHDVSTSLGTKKTHFLSNIPAACCALGYTHKGKYRLGEYSKEAVRELIRYLRRDDADHTARRYLGKAKVLVLDLIPIVKHYHADHELFDLVLRLLVNLTNPVLLLYREELPEDPASRRCYLQIISLLQVYKEAFTDEAIWAVFVKKLTTILETDATERSEETGMVAERILVLTRNVLQVPADPTAEERPDCDATIHDKVIWALHQSAMTDLLLFLSSSDSEQAYCMHVLEIICLMLRDQNATDLANSQSERSLMERTEDVEKLLSSRTQEKMAKYNKVKSSLVTRHSKFGGSFVLKNVKGVGEQDLIVHKPYNDADKVPHGITKTKRKRMKRDMPLRDDEEKRRSPLSIRLFLQVFCNEFLRGAYNTLMRYVKGCLMRKIAQPNDESFYLWAMRFFMEFNRISKNEVKLVSETMNMTCFYWVITQMEHSQSMLKADKKKLIVWSRRTHLALRAYLELLLTLSAMEFSTDNAVRQSAQVIQGNLFYVVEHREALLWMLNTFEETKMSRAYLQDLIETLHVFTKLLERSCKKQRGLVVQTKQVRRKKNKKSKKSNPGALNAGATTNPTDTQSNEELWDEVAPQLSVVLSNGVIPEDVVPFDAASDRDIEEQKVDAMRRIHTMLKHHQYEEAVGLLRASREVWQDNEIFGRTNAAPEEELITLREVFVADIAQDPEVVAAQTVENGNENEGDEESDEEEEDDEEEEGVPSYNEKEFDFDSFLKRLVTCKAIQPVCKLLSSFETNSNFVNHCVAKLLHRIAWDAKSPAVLFQASVFIQFRKILASTRPEHQELAKLAVYIFRKFTEVAEKNKLAFVELLFWKSPKEAYAMEDNYEDINTESAASKKMWKEEEEDELRRLHAEFLRDEPDEDMIDWILARLLNRNRSKAGVKKKLRELFLVLPQEKGKRPPKEWSESEICQLTQLYTEHKDSNDPMEHILAGLTVKRGKAKVLDKLLELGLLSDRKQLHKKSRSKSSVRRGGINASSSDGGSSDSDAGRTNKRNAKKKQELKDRAVLRKAQRKKAPEAIGQITTILRQVIEADLRGGLEWLLESLSDVADDLETTGNDDVSDGVPLVPVDEAAVAAMDNPLFHRLLQNLGLCPPFDEQEIYWRIPEDIPPADLRRKVSLLQSALDGTLPSDVIEEIQPAIEVEEISSDEANQSVVLSRRKEKSTKKKPKRRNPSLEDEGRNSRTHENNETPERSMPASFLESESDHEQESTLSNNKKKKDRRRSLLDSDSDVEPLIPSNNKNKNSKTKGLAKNRSAVQSDSDSERDIEKSGQTSSTSRPFNLNFLLDSDSDIERDMLSRGKKKDRANQTKSSAGKHSTQKSIQESDSNDEQDSLSADQKKKKNKKHGRLRKLPRSDSEDEVRLSHNESSREADENNINSGNVSTISTARKVVTLDSDSDQPAQSTTLVLSDSESEKSKASQRKRRFLSSSDDSDDNSKTKGRNAKRVLSSSDEEMSVVKKRAVIVED